jgi:hypothetical protein
VLGHCTVFMLDVMFLIYTSLALVVCVPLCLMLKLSPELSEQERSVLILMVW